MRAELIALALFIALPSAAAVTELDARYEVVASSDDGSAYSASHQRALTPWLDARIAARLSTGLIMVRGFHYAGELSLPITSFLALKARLHQGMWFKEITSVTHLLATAELEAFPVSAFGAVASFGWYERWGRIAGPLPVPTFSGSLREHDFAGSLGLEVRPSDEWKMRAYISTYDTIQIFNLNHPYLETRIGYSAAGTPWEVTGYFRYQVMLGFGRWDTLAGGLSLAIKESFAGGS